MTDATAGRPGPVVVGVDGSDNAQRALATAAQLALDTGAAVLAVHALGLLTGSGEQRMPAFDHRGDVEERMRAQWCAVLAERIPDRWTAELIDGSPAETLLATAAERDASFIVVGARGVGGHPDLMLGSTSHRVIERAVCPTVVVPPAGRR